MKKIKVVAAATALVAMGLMAGCGSDKPADTAKTAGPSGKVMVYTSIYPDIIDNTCKPNVAKALPNVTTKWFQGGTEKIMTKMQGEIRAKKIGADLVMVADPSYYIRLKNDGQLLDYVSPNAKDVISAKDKKGAWTAVRISNMIIAYNADKVKGDDIPKTWADLTDPKWKGKVGMPNPLLSGSTFVAVGALSDKYGWDYFKALKANNIRVEPGNSAVQNKLLTGEYDVAMILEENILKIANTKNEPLKVSYPTDGVVSIPSPIAIMKATKNPEGAKAVEDWWLSKDGQQAIVKGWMHSVRGDVPAPKGAPAYKTFVKDAIPVDWAKLDANNAKIKSEFRKIVIDGK